MYEEETSDAATILLMWGVGVVISKDQSPTHVYFMHTNLYNMCTLCSILYSGNSFLEITILLKKANI